MATHSMDASWVPIDLVSATCPWPRLIQAATVGLQRLQEHSNAAPARSRYTQIFEQAHDPCFRQGEAPSLSSNQSVSKFFLPPHTFVLALSNSAHMPYDSSKMLHVHRHPQPCMCLLRILRVVRNKTRSGLHELVENMTALNALEGIFGKERNVTIIS